MSIRERIVNIITQLIQEADEQKKIIYQEVLQKISEIDDENLSNIVQKELGYNVSDEVIRTYFEDKAQEQFIRRHFEVEGQEKKFIEINEKISYHIQDKKTLCLHLVPNKVTTTDMRMSGKGLVEALDCIREMIDEDNFQDVESIFAVSDILRLRLLQENFESLGFKIRNVPQFKKLGFKNPYSASLNRNDFISDEWKAKRDLFENNGFKKPKDDKNR